MASETEGTDTIVNGAAASPPDETRFEPASSGGAAPPAGTTFTPEGQAPTAMSSLKSKLGEGANSLKGQATDKARAYAEQGKERASGALDELVKLIEDAASTIDEKVGDQYGAYARRAAEGLGSLATTLREKDVDELFDQARETVRKSPAVAVGAAAAIGFVVARLIKAAADGASTEDKPKA